MGKNTAPPRAEINVSVFSGTYYALYMFIFLLAELVIQDRAAAVAGAETVVPAYCVGLIATAAGYLLLPLSRALVRSDAARRAMLVCAGAIFLFSFGLIVFVGHPFFFMLLAAVAMLAIGYVGAFAHYAVSVDMNGSPYLGITVGCAICAAVLIQYLVQNYTGTAPALMASIAAALALSLWMPLKGQNDECRSLRPVAKESLKAANDKLTCVIAACLMSAAMGISDAIVTDFSARGDVTLSAYPRLFYAVSLVMAGFIADIKDRRCLPIATVCVLLFSVIVTSFLEGSFGFVISLATLYFLGGFVILYITLAFIEMAPRTAAPALWAGMGRVVRSLTIGFIAVPGVKLFQHAGHQLLTIISISLSLAVLLLFYATGKLNNPIGRKKSPAGGTAASFARRYGLSGRENEIAELVIMSDDSINELAEQMAISGRAFQRSLTAIYEKTGTKSRLGLVRLYYECLAEEEAARESDTTA